MQYCKITRHYVVVSKETEVYKSFFDEHNVPYTLIGAHIPYFNITYALSELINWLYYYYKRATGICSPKESLSFIFQPTDNFIMFLALHGYDRYSRVDLHDFKTLHNSFHSYVKQISSSEIIK